MTDPIWSNEHFMQPSRIPESDDHMSPMPQGPVYLSDARAAEFFRLSGFSAIDRVGRWSDGPTASVEFRLPENRQKHILLKIRAGAFSGRPSVPEQVITVSVNGTNITQWVVNDPTVRTRALFIDRAELPAGETTTIRFYIPNCAQPCSLGINDDARFLGICLSAVAWEEVDQKPPATSPIWQLGRQVGAESRKSFDDKVENGFWSRFITGPKVLDIGFKGALGAQGVVPIVEGAIGIDLDYPGYDGRTLPFGDNTRDAVYSSHCLEHIPDFIKSIQEWYRVVRMGGHIITVVPSKQLYERRWRPPSKRNASHMRFYTPAALLAEFEQALAANSYRVRHLKENDTGYDYDSSPDRPPAGCYEIELVIEKIRGPAWQLEP